MVFDTPIAGPSFAVRLENLAAMASRLREERARAAADAEAQQRSGTIAKPS